MPSAYLQWRFHSGEGVVARGPLVTKFYPKYSDRASTVDQDQTAP